MRSVLAWVEACSLARGDTSQDCVGLLEHYEEVSVWLTQKPTEEEVKLLQEHHQLPVRQDVDRVGPYWRLVVADTPSTITLDKRVK